MRLTKLMNKEQASSLVCGQRLILGCDMRARLVYFVERGNVCQEGSGRDTLFYAEKQYNSPEDAPSTELREEKRLHVLPFDGRTVGVGRGVWPRKALKKSLDLDMYPLDRAAGLPYVLLYSLFKKNIGTFGKLTEHTLNTLVTKKNVPKVQAVFLRTWVEDVGLAFAAGAEDAFTARALDEEAREELKNLLQPRREIGLADDQPGLRARQKIRKLKAKEAAERGAQGAAEALNALNKSGARTEKSEEKSPEEAPEAGKVIHENDITIIDSNGEAKVRAEEVKNLREFVISVECPEEPDLKAVFSDGKDFRALKLATLKGDRVETNELNVEVLKLKGWPPLRVKKLLKHFADAVPLGADWEKMLKSAQPDGEE